VLLKAPGTNTAVILMSACGDGRPISDVRLEFDSTATAQLPNGRSPAAGISQRIWR
jgi:hypothetical protein